MEQINHIQVSKQILFKLSNKEIGHDAKAAFEGVGSARILRV